MTPIYPGHRYELTRYDGEGVEVLQFVQRRPLHKPFPGTINQEVLRVLIDRVEVLDSEIPWEGNREILYHLRMALVLHECRALRRKVETGKLKFPEKLSTAHDGHFIIKG